VRFFAGVDFDFVRLRRVALLVSGSLLVLGAVSVAIRGGLRMSIDFEGGNLVQVRFQDPVPLERIREVLTNAGLAGSEVQNFGDANEVLIRTRQSGKEKVGDVIRGALRAELPTSPFTMRREEEVGPKIGRELQRNATLAILFAMGAIVAYVSWRFAFRMAVAAVAALFHDVFITLGVFSLSNREVSLAVVAALLTIVGYSLNDTIVVFDRVRENLKLLRKERYGTIVNSSICQTLSRTVITSLTTLFAVTTLYVVGGGVIRDFSFALLVGILVGTYSSVFVASPILVVWHERRHRKKR
jgi:preprotein translocase SecF subunit